MENQLNSINSTINSTNINKNNKKSIINKNVKRKSIHQYKYESPYILAASKLAEERAKSMKNKYKSSRSKITINDWDLNTKTPGLFDPLVKKVDLFKPQPGVHIYNNGKLIRESDINRNVIKIKSVDNSIDDSRPNRLTIRTNKNAPVNYPNKYFYDNPNKLIHENNKFNNNNNNNNRVINNNVIHSAINPVDDKIPIQINNYINKDIENINIQLNDKVQSRSTSPFDDNIIKYLYSDNVNEYIPPITIDRPNSYPNRFPSPNRQPASDLNAFKPSTDIMNGMAKLIDAVGNMVSNVSDVVSQNKTSKKQKKSYNKIITNPPMIDQSTSPVVIDILNDLEIKSPSTNKYYNRIDKNKPTIDSNNVIRNKDSTSINPKKLTKTSVLDMVLTKLQDIEIFENQIIQTLDNISTKKEANSDVNNNQLVDMQTINKPIDIIDSNINESLVIDKHSYTNLLPDLSDLNYDTMIALKSHKQEIDKIIKYRDIPFKSNKLDFINVVEQISNHISDELLNEVYNEIDDFIDEYANHFINKI